MHCKSQLYFYDSKTTLFSYRLFGSEGNGYKRTTRQRNAWNATFMLIVSKSLRQGDHSDSGLYKFGLEVIVATSLFVNLAGVGMYYRLFDHKFVHSVLKTFGLKYSTTGVILSH